MPLNTKLGLIPLTTLATLGCLSSSSAQAANFFVNATGGGTGAAFTSPMLPQEAINAAVSGDTIYFDTDYYTLTTATLLDVNVAGKVLTLIGNGIGLSVLDLSGESINLSAADVTMQGFSIESGAAGNEVDVNGSVLTLMDSEVVLFTSPNAVRVYNGSTATVTNVRFMNNVTGLRVLNGSDVNVGTSLFDGHAASAVVLAGCSTATDVHDNDFTNNLVGLRIADTWANSTSTVQHNTLVGNGRGIEVVAVGGGFIPQDHLFHNKIDTSAEYAINSTVAGSLVDIDANYLTNNGAGIHLVGTQDTVHNNVIADTLGSAISPILGDGIITLGSAATIAHNTVVRSANQGIVGVGGDVSLVANNASVANANYGVVAFGSAGMSVGSNMAFNNGLGNFLGPFIGLGGNFSAPPLFVAPNDFHVNLGSSLIDTGNAALFAEPVDFDGVARPAGLAVDIGAYER